MTDSILVASDLEPGKIIIGFKNSSGELEYTIYEAKDGGVITNPSTDLPQELAEAGEMSMGDIYYLPITPGMALNI